MPIFIVQGRYSREAISGMVAKPDDRAAAVGKLMEGVGGKLLAYYLTFGPYDFHLTVEAPDERAMLAALAAAGAGPGVSDLNTCLAVPMNQAMESFAKAKTVMSSFKSAGSG